LFRSDIWRLTENNYRRGRSYREGCSEEILKNIKKRKNQKCNYKTTHWTRGNNYKRNFEQNQLTWYGHVQRMAEGRFPQNSIEMDAETKDSKRKTE
jgi:hypothetical protein